MEVLNSLFVQGAVFTFAVLAIFGCLTWYLFFSPARHNAYLLAERPSPALINLVVFFLGTGMALSVVGGMWDASMHVQTGEVPGGSDFLWTPHLLIYGGFLLSLLTALVAFTVVAVNGRRKGITDPRLWVRANPYLGAVALAATYSLMAVPGDAIWHELFGLDLTAWSPPHVIMALMNSIVTLSAVALWLQKPTSERGSATRPLVTMLLLALMLNELYMVGVLEWELPGGRSQWVEARPIWLYPLVGGSLALSVLLLSRYLSGLRWAATMTAVLFYLIRLSITVGLDQTGNVTPYLPLMFLLGAVMLDIVPVKHIYSRLMRVVLRSAAFTAGYIPLALLFLIQRTDLPSLTQVDWLVAAGLTLTLGLFFAPLIGWAGRRLRSRRESFFTGS